MSTYQHGIPAGAAKTGWLIQNFQTAPGKDKSEARGDNGAVADVEYYNEIETFTATAIVPIDEVTPKPGQTFTIDGVTYFIDTASKTFVNTDYSTFALSGTHYVTNGLPSQSSSYSN